MPPTNTIEKTAAPAYSAANSPAGDLRHLSLDAIRPSLLNPRKRFDDDALQELAASIKADGVLQPIVVRPWVEPGLSGEAFEIVAGERRWRASRLAGLATIPAMVRSDVADAQLLRLALIENVKRKDLDPMEEAEAYRQLQQLGLKQTEIAEQVGRSQPAVAKTLGLLNLPEDVQERIRSGALSATHGAALERFSKFPELVSKMAELAASRRMSAGQLEDKDVLERQLSWELRDANVITWLHADQEPFKQCRGACPFDAYRASGSAGLCLKPAHKAELEQQHAAAENVAMAALVEKAQAGGSEGLPKLQTLTYGSYVELKHYRPLPVGCGKECKCRGAALDGQEPVDICTDPKRFRSLVSAAERANQKDKQRRGQILSRQVQLAIESIAEVDRREISIIAAKAMHEAHVNSAYRASVLHIAAPAGLQTSTYWDIDAKKLATITPEAAVKLVLEAILLGDIANAYDHEYSGGKPPELVTWFLEKACWWDPTDETGSCFGKSVAARCGHIADVPPDSAAPGVRIVPPAPARPKEPPKAKVKAPRMPRSVTARRPSNWDQLNAEHAASKHEEPVAGCPDCVQVETRELAEAGV
jgi:ParB/RepB/Spo0J family partition protein